MPVLNADDIVKKQIDEHGVRLGQQLQADVIAFLGPIQPGIDDFIRDAIESIADKKKKLAVVVETTGGSIETTARIAECLRHHYDIVDFVVPNFAMSAGTILVMSGDSIYMDYYSILGPIDPQVHKKGIGWVPALGYLER